ncbi:MAG: hypothetical protein NT075_28775 [Chloroflexi bacterium]|nr:hypothetical protein [Chloroflexota bacterium]
MWVDPIVEETRSIRDKIASRFDYDILALGEYFKAQKATTISSALSKVRSRKAQPKKYHTEMPTEEQTFVKTEVDT